MKNKPMYFHISFFPCGTRVAILSTVISLFYYSTIPLLHAAFKETSWGVRPGGMGDAYTAVSDDVNAVYHNPAGVTQSDFSEMTFAHSKPFMGLDETNLNTNMFAAIMPVSDLGYWGTGWSSLRGPVYRQDDVSVLLATPLNRWVSAMTPEVSLGVNLHYLHHRFDLDTLTRSDSVFAGGRSKSALSVDAGFWIQPDPQTVPGLSLGLSAKNINQPNAGLASEDKAYRETSVGVAYQFRRGLITADMVKRRRETSWAAGFEKRFFKRFSFRGGANPTTGTMGLGYRRRIGKKKYMEFDYAYGFPLSVDETGGSHRASVGLRF
ncbi:MAG TPA: hypothetical protein PK876_08495 [Elusimicrobiota bacterium]|nr:hypothetical protein [Elusimicrobiota bacterium]